MKKYLIVGVIIIVLALLGLLSIFPRPGVAKVVFVNDSTQEVVFGQIEVSDQRLTFERLKPGERMPMTFRVTKASHYRVSVQLESGKKPTADLGYVTRGVDFEDTIRLTDDAILLGPNSQVK